MKLIATYPTPTGPRQLITVTVPDAEHPITLLDVPASAPVPENLVVVDHEIDTDDEAWGLALDYLEAALRAGVRPDRCDVFDADALEHLDPVDELPALMRKE